MFSASVFVEGRRQLTNKMLSDLRAAGVYEGKARGMCRKPRPGHDLYAGEVEAIRMLSRVAWLQWREGQAGIALAHLTSGGLVEARSLVLRGLPAVLSVRLYVTGHCRHDPDSWYLLAKPAVDGMVRALDLSDRFRVWDVAGRVAQSGDEIWRDWSAAGRPAGFVMEMREVRL